MGTTPGRRFNRRRLPNVNANNIYIFWDGRWQLASGPVVPCVIADAWYRSRSRWQVGNGGSRNPVAQAGSRPCSGASPVWSMNTPGGYRGPVRSQVRMI